jgi:tetratricopeptide (TPR) repeat protein
MMRLSMMLFIACASSPVAAQQPSVPPHADMADMTHSGMSHDDMTAPKTPQIMPGYGNGGFPITTSVLRAQQFFDNGMQLDHAFAHKAAIGAMAEAVRLDSSCAMCLWGQAWASGPTINFGKTAEELKPLADMANKAAGFAEKAGTEREKALIHALQLRYKDSAGKNGDLNFAKSMAALASRYPTDNEISVIAADAWLMTPADTPEDIKLNAELAMPLLESVLKRSPDYTPAIHFYIHATEMAGVPGLAEPYANKLAALAPRASHLVHMPSHTYYWVGRYQDAANANMRAVEIGIENAKTLGLPPPNGVWGLPYHAHNVIYGLGGALQAGDAKTALWLGRPLVERSQAKASASAFNQLIAANGYFAMALFADPAEVLALPQPKVPFLLAAWHYARGEAFARKGQASGVRKEAAAIRGSAGKLIADDGSAQAQQLTFIARNVLAGRAAMMEGRPEEAAADFQQAAEIQESDDFTSVSDPPAWYYPVRRDVAAAKLKMGDKAGARDQAEAALKYRAKDPGTLALLQTLGPAVKNR